MEDDHPPEEEALEAREPTVEDLVELCRRLNSGGARYVVVGGFAIRAAGYDRRTMDIDLLVETGVDNEAKVLEALSHLPDHAARELEPGEVAKYVVVRVADEIVVDLMGSASGLDYEAARPDIAVHDVDGVPIPFASPRLLWRMKSSTGRDKDLPDLHFLKYLFAQTGQGPEE